jgi:hypothetical protein
LVEIRPVVSAHFEITFGEVASFKRAANRSPPELRTVKAAILKRVCQNGLAQVSVIEATSIKLRRKPTSNQFAAAELDSPDRTSDLMKHARLVEFAIG